MNNATPSANFIGKLECWGMAILTTEKGHIEFGKEWESSWLDLWLCDILLKAFDYLDKTYGKPGTENHWVLVSDPEEDIRETKQHPKWIWLQWHIVR